MADEGAVTDAQLDAAADGVEEVAEEVVEPTEEVVETPEEPEGLLL